MRDEWNETDKRGPDPAQSKLEMVVLSAVKKGIQESNLIDGPTHLAHHQAFEEFLNLMRHAKKTFVGALVIGIFGLLALGVTVWKRGV